MPTNHHEIANFIWSICNLLRGPYKRNEYRKVILPLTVLRRFDCLLAPTKMRHLRNFKPSKSNRSGSSHKLQQDHRSSLLQSVRMQFDLPQSPAQ